MLSLGFFSACSGSAATPNSPETAPPISAGSATPNSPDRQPSSTPTEDFLAALIDFTPEPTRSVEEITAQWSTSEFLGGRHRGAGLTCMVCHDPFPPEGKPITEICLACHGEGSIRGMTRLTSNLEPNPHDWHYGTLSCGFCHYVHEEQPPPCGFCHSDVKLGPKISEP